MIRRIFLSLLVSLTLLAVSATAWAGAPTDAVKAKQAELFKLLGAEQNDANKKKITAIFDEMLDYDALAQSSLGDEWKKLSDAEKKEFADLLKQLVKGAYERNLRKTLDFNIEYLGDEKKGDAHLVKTKAKHKTDTRAEPIEINFKLADKGGGKFKIIDIETEEVSLVSSYRSQFTAIMKKDGFAGLVKKMKDKIAKGQ